MTCFTACSFLLGLTLLLAPRPLHAQSAPPVPASTELVPAPPSSESPTAAPGHLTPAQKKTYLRLWARVSLVVIICFILFVVVLMVVSRHLRLWILGRHRPVKFEPVEDLWWKKPDQKPTRENRKP